MEEGWTIQWSKSQTMIDKTQHRELKIEEYEPSKHWGKLTCLHERLILLRRQVWVRK